jgi:hypothetical protein
MRLTYFETWFTELERDKRSVATFSIPAGLAVELAKAAIERWSETHVLLNPFASILRRWMAYAR